MMKKMIILVGGGGGGRGERKKERETKEILDPSGQMGEGFLSSNIIISP